MLPLNLCGRRDQSDETENLLKYYHMGFTKGSRRSLVGRMPTSTRERERDGWGSYGGGGQNANKLCKKPFVKPT